MTQTTSPALPRSAIWAFGLVAMPLSTIGLPLAIYLAPFYAGEMGLSLAALGTAMLIARFADICIDPFVGAFSDRLRSRFGRRKPFLVVGSVVLLLGMSQLFNPGKGVTLVYFLGWLAVMYAGFSLIQVPHRAWGAELSPFYDERTRISSVRQFFSTGGLIVSTLVPAVVLGQAGAKSSDVLFALTVMTVIALPIVAGINLYFTPEPAPTPRPPRARFDWKANWRALRRNGPLQCILLVVFIGFSAETFRQTLTVFFARDVIGVKNLGLVYVYYFISAFCGVPCWRWVAKRTSKHHALAAGMVIAICTNLGLYLLGKGDTALFTAMFILKGFCFGALDLLPAAMLADAADVDTAITHKSRNGLLFAVFGVVTNLGQAVGQGASLNALSWVGYHAAGETAPAALASLSLLYAVIPSAALGLAMLIALRYSLTAKRHERLRVLLQGRKALAGT
ncbi:MFS transporter [Roseateles toxinivorans]|uniref:Na+/melibiose symporter-like transporter n=1 Tax=Roseateles toxinivorans TaxID=270368 RepID=A0A4R6QCI2_9BURK|nr:MFS transporter [Roseateles toxinivorans]TDP60484.1 Na+/melibiose symporter-like transporter [Roseateles toxinivorans]